MRKWRKKGLIYCPSGKNGFDYSHCHKPTPLLIDENTLRVYFGVRDKTRKTRTTFVDLSLDDLGSVKYVHNKPILDLGKIGAFDDSGANVSSVCRNGDEIYMYFIGWNPSTTVHTRNSVGLAVSRDNGFTFERMYDGPVLDRTKDEPYYTGAVDVINEKDIWKVWYTSGSEWKIINGRPEIFYHISTAHRKTELTGREKMLYASRRVMSSKPLHDHPLSRIVRAIRCGIANEIWSIFEPRPSKVTGLGTLSLKMGSTGKDLMKDWIYLYLMRDGTPKQLRIRMSGKLGGS